MTAACTTSDTQRANALWADYARTHDPRTREEIVHQFERLAYSIANRFTRRGAENEDLFQVARIGLVKAVDRFDPETAYRFSTFATPTILGEIRRYFRDHARPIHVPRGLQETAALVSRVADELTERFGRRPTPHELAERLEMTEEQVREALAVDDASRPLSLDEQLETAGRETSGTLEQFLGEEDHDLDLVEHRVGLTQALLGLSKEFQKIIRLRYFEQLSQREVARRLGLSQMQVNRRERRALEELRAQLSMN